MFHVHRLNAFLLFSIAYSINWVYKLFKVQENSKDCRTVAPHFRFVEIVSYKIGFIITHHNFIQGRQLGATSCTQTLHYMLS